MRITVTPLLNYRNKTIVSGLYGIHLRVTIRREQRYYPIRIPLKVRPNQWSGLNDQWVRNNHLYSFEINNRISELKSRITSVVKRCYNQSKPVTFYAIERELTMKGDRSVLNDYVLNYIERPPANVVLTEVTWEKYNAFLKHLNSFQQRVLFSDIDEIFIARFRNYLAAQSGKNGKLNAGTIKSYFDKFKVVLMQAAKKDHLLDITEVSKLRRQTFLENEFSLRRDRDLFLLQVYTGFYYNDLQILKKDQLFNDVECDSYIISERDKNGHPRSSRFLNFLMVMRS